jgi:phosphatidate phosphatase APP1
VRKRPFIAARIEKQVNRRIGTTLRRLGWRDTVIAYTGYGSTTRLRVLGRVVITHRSQDVGSAITRESAWDARRGWRNFVNLPAVNRAIQVDVGGRVTNAITDRDGYIDIAVSRHGLTPGWHHVTLSAGDSDPVEAPVLIIDPQVRFGIVSDIDDTIITSYLPRLLLAAYNSFILTESARVPVAGMAAMYASLLRGHPNSPIIYLSTGAWSTQPFLERFIGRHGYPSGPMLLTDWGPTNTGWFRSGPDHKRSSLEALARDFPQISWLLVGDDGQHDPALYSWFAARHPDNVAGIVIRQLPVMEQVLAHGTPSEMTIPGLSSTPSGSTPEVRGPDGYVLRSLVQSMLARRDQSSPS